MESDTVGELEPQLVTIRAGAYEDEFYFATSLSLKQKAVSNSSLPRRSWLGFVYFFQFRPVNFGSGFLARLPSGLPAILRTVTLYWKK